MSMFGNLDDLKSSFVNRVAMPTARKLGNIVSNFSKPAESASNSFVNKNWFQDQGSGPVEKIKSAIGVRTKLLSPVPADKTMGTQEYLQNKSNDFWDKADYGDALKAEIKYAPTRIKQEIGQNPGNWIPIKNLPTPSQEPSTGQVLGESSLKMGPTVKVKKSEPINQAARAAMSIEDPIMREKATQTFPLIAAGFEKVGISDPRAIAYALSTFIGEAGAKLDAVEPVYQPGDSFYQNQQNYEGGPRYRGRGAIQLTHKSNYKKFGDMLGIDLVNNPELAADPTISPMIMALFFKDKGVLDEINKGNYDRARVLVQGHGAISPRFYSKTQEIGKQAIEFSDI